ncbi:Zn-dependent hydrolase [Siminovitchia terrae]|uniref:MBL fold metallo-hydrolase n=1 Tax=Siminovitchia terrae TaxID=1914933 RepID=A0A429X160_SIMTE|nr:rhodanese-like domain-containing protein [Siminovitchia terrae]RST57172.1 MBL fold metallo-hydrolase [Siminovitchia terrae]GIN96254.1 Zn-dependent hydrolase [Siminovitchia terrae]
MLLRYFYDEYLAHASYMVGCQKTGEAIVIDPSRNIGQYIVMAKANGLRVTAATETHVHADFVSGARELEARTGAKIYLSDEGGINWKYDNLINVNHQLLKDGDIFSIGHLKFEVMHTPGHTPESISFLLTDTGGGADRPMGVFTGDFIFVGDVGRPDLLETAVGDEGAAEQGAKEMFASIERFKQLPDYLQIWPAHGAGSACGKSLGAIPSSTAGYEKMFNPALQYHDEETFSRDLLRGQPEPPKYFSIMKQVNKSGPTFKGDLAAPSKSNDQSDLIKWLKNGIVIDTRNVDEFGKGHIPGTINIPFNKSFVKWAGWLIDYDKPLYLLVEAGTMNKLLTALYSIGIERIAGYMDVVSAIRNHPHLESYEEIEPEHVNYMERSAVLDVRNQDEWGLGCIPGAAHIMLGTLPDRLDEVPQGCPIVVYCASGIRSAMAASILQANGIKDVYNLKGGYSLWKKQKVVSTKSI